MTTLGLLVRLHAKPGKEADVEALLISALPLIRREADTSAWFAIRFGRSEYGIFDAFPDEAAREAHLSGPVAAALMARADALFALPPNIQKLDVLADKLPPNAPYEPDAKALLLTFKAKSGNEQGAAQFLRDAKPWVEAEPGTTAWFAIRLETGEYGIFDVFPNRLARFKHLTGRVPRALAKRVFSLVGSLPVLRLPGLLAEKLGA
jgi:quinol monooxygenase YgiN